MGDNKTKLNFAQMVEVCDSMIIDEHARELGIELTDPDYYDNYKISFNEFIETCTHNK